MFFKTFHKQHVYTAILGNTTGKHNFFMKHGQHNALTDFYCTTALYCTVVLLLHCADMSKTDATSKRSWKEEHLCCFFKVEGLNSPYLGSFNFCGLKNLILPSFSVSIRWLYGCSAEWKQTFIMTTIILACTLQVGNLQNLICFLLFWPQGVYLQVIQVCSVNKRSWLYQPNLTNIYPMEISS